METKTKACWKAEFPARVTSSPLLDKMQLCVDCWSGPQLPDQGSSWVQIQLSSQEGPLGLLATPISPAPEWILLSEIPVGRKVGFSPDGRPPALKVTVRLWFLAPELAFAVCVGWKLDLSRHVFVLFRGRWHVAMCAFWPGGWQDLKGGSCCPLASEVFFFFHCFIGQGAGVLLGQRALCCVD